MNIQSKEHISQIKGFMNYMEKKTSNLSFQERVDDFDDWITDMYELEHLQYRRESISGSKPMIEIIDIYTDEKKRMINLASNDYLNLTKHPRVINAGISALMSYGLGSGSVPLLAGTLDIHKKLERRIAEFKSTEDAIIFPSGFVSNYGFLSTMLKENDAAIIDMYAHASLFEGCLHRNKHLFLHNNMKSLEKVLRECENNYRNKIIVVDGVYSMDGDIAPLDKIVPLARKYGAHVLIDEAHATGVIGSNGKGTLEFFGMEGEVDFVAGTFSKGLGGVGGFIATNKKVVAYLNYLCRPFMFSTAPSPSVTGGLIEAINVLEQEKSLRKKLWDNIYYFKNKLLSKGFNIGNSETAIFPIIFGHDSIVKEVCRILHQNNVYANPVLYPAVPRRLARIRFSVTSGLKRDELDKAIDVLEFACKEVMK